ncbi:MAG: hypothetical protein WDN47_01635 [Candidatus Doudnabacteria bacterium]
MTEVTQEKFCQNCRRKLNFEEKPCSNCGSVAAMIKVHIKETTNIRMSLELKHKRNGFKRPLKEIIQGWFQNIITKDKEFGVDKVRIIDREKDEYHEVVRDLKTNELIRDKHEPLSHHKI